MIFDLVYEDSTDEPCARACKCASIPYDSARLGKLRNELRALLRWADASDEKWTDARKAQVAQQMHDLERRIEAYHEMACEIASVCPLARVDYGVVHGVAREIPLLFELPEWAREDVDSEDAASEEE